MLKQLMKRCVCKIWRNVLITVVAHVVFDEIRTCIPFENSAVEQNIVATDTSLLFSCHVCMIKCCRKGVVAALFVLTFYTHNQVQCVGNSPFENVLSYFLPTLCI